MWRAKIYPICWNEIQSIGPNWQNSQKIIKCANISILKNTSTTNLSNSHRNRHTAYNTLIIHFNSHTICLNLLSNSQTIRQIPQKCVQFVSIHQNKFQLDRHSIRTEQKIPQIRTKCAKICPICHHACKCDKFSKKSSNALMTAIQFYFNPISPRKSVFTKWLPFTISP